MTAVAIIQARMGSTRCPGKVLRELAGRSVLEWCVNRTRRATCLDQVVVATTTNPDDRILFEYCERVGIPCFRGSEHDVLDRYYQAALKYTADVVVRITSDCPLIEPGVIDQCIGKFEAPSSTELAYVSNIHPRRTYPRGLDTEVFSFQALEKAWREAKEPAHREHVTPYIWQQPRLFPQSAITAEDDQSHHRWTLDTPEDLQLLELLFGELHDPLTTGWKDILKLLHDHPDWIEINRHVEQVKVLPMAKDRLLFRADAGSAMGTGHVMRCLALAQAWQGAGKQAVFATAERTPALEERLVEEGIELHSIPASPGDESDAVRTAALARQLGAVWVVVDGYRFGPEFLMALKREQRNVLLIDDEGRADLPAIDLLLNQNIHADASLYPHRASESGLLLGTGYALLRREFSSWRNWSRKQHEHVSRILVTFGGGDADNLTGRFLKALDEVEVQGNRLEITAVVGPANPHLDKLEQQAVGLRHHVRLLSNVTDMPALMAEADLAICAGGSTCWELCLMGLPAMLVEIAPNQREIAEGMHKAGAAINLGRYQELAYEEIVTVLRTWLASTARDREGISRAGQALVDGMGAHRVLDAMEKLNLERHHADRMSGQ